MRKKKKRHVFVTLVQLLALAAMAYCLAQAIPKLLEYMASDGAFRAIRENAVSNLDPTEKEKETEGQTETETEDLPDDLDTALHIDWEEFEGTDIVAWIQLDDISYPVMYSKDNDTYLHHLPDGTYNYGGSLFLYNQNNPLFTDESSFIYGHNMANGSMFGTLRKYTDEGYKDHRFYIYLPDGRRLTYRFYSVVSTRYDSEAYTWYFSSRNSFLDWQDWMAGQSLYENSQEPDPDAQYVTLSTCNGYAGTDNRLLITGQLEREDKLQEPASWYDPEKWQDFDPWAIGNGEDGIWITEKE